MKRSESPLMDALLVVGLLGGTTLLLTTLFDWSKTKKAEPPPAPAVPGLPAVLPINLLSFFPDLAVGDRVVVQPLLANLPEPLRPLPSVVGTVDLVLTDRSLVSVRVQSPSPFAGTIPRTSILSVVPKGVFA